MEESNQPLPGQVKIRQALLMLGYNGPITFHLTTVMEDDGTGPYFYRIGVSIYGAFSFWTKTRTYDTELSREVLFDKLAISLEKKLGITRARYGEVKQPKRPAKRKVL